MQKINKLMIFLNQLQYQSVKQEVDNAKYRLAAMNKLTKIDSKACNNEEILVDDDALVSSSNTGAYVQCWLWVDNDVKPKRTRKRVNVMKKMQLVCSSYIVSI
jgi:hypothetical protein